MVKGVTAGATQRENFRAAFHDFAFDRIARFTQRDINRLLKDEGIVLHRGKIEAVINDHVGDCVIRSKAEKARNKFKVPRG